MQSDSDKWTRVQIPGTNPTRPTYPVTQPDPTNPPGASCTKYQFMAMIYKPLTNRLHKLCTHKSRHFLNHKVF